MKLYIIRHAQALSNIGKAETPNSDLSELGKKQALLIPEFFKDKKLDAIYSSPFRRVVQTALPLAEKKGLNITLAPEMCEIFNGEWLEYRDYVWETREEITNEFKGATFIEPHKKQNWWPNWPESSDMVMERVKEFYGSYLNQYFDTDKNIVVFGHGHTTDDLKQLVCPESDYPAPNAGVFKYEIDSFGNCTDSRMILDHIEGMVTY